jgi:hypothetical protein
MSKDFKINNKEEYISLREEIILRLGKRHEHIKKASTMFISVCYGSFALIAYSFGKDFLNNELEILGILIPASTLAFLLSSILMFLLICIFYSLSLEIYINTIGINNIGSYLAEFHEKPISENDGSFFSWETANGNWIKYLRSNEPKIAKKLASRCIELSLLSYISLALSVFFLAAGLWNIANNSIVILIIAIAYATVTKICLINKIGCLSSNKSVEEISKKAQEFWGSYPSKEEKGNSDSSTTNQMEV